MITTGTRSVLTRTDSFLNKLNPKTIMAELTGRSIPAPKKLKLLTLEDYKQDIRARWLILQREINELIIDIKKFIDFVTPMVKSTFDKLESLFSKKKT
tara:strand:- start:7805 stop:8098 length:294 start_codon:yes stop_codon:yes gene_type:complete